MSEELNIGDYVRTKNITFQPSQIAKIQNMQKDSGYNNQYYIELDHNLLNNYNFHIYEEDVTKSSPNIIDLIEVGDYVNGCIVINKKDETIQIIQLIIPFDLKEKDIKSIVTKEQFESMQYKVGE